MSVFMYASMYICVFVVGPFGSFRPTDHFFSKKRKKKSEGEAGCRFRWSEGRVEGEGALGVPQYRSSGVFEGMSFYGAEWVVTLISPLPPPPTHHPTPSLSY